MTPNRAIRNLCLDCRWNNRGICEVPTGQCTEIKTLNESMIEWINTKDRMPEKNKRVLGVVYGHDLIYCEDGETIEQAIDRIQRTYKHVTLCHYVEEYDQKGKLVDKGWYESDGFPMIIHPTLWAELPEAPDYDDIEK